MLPSSRFASCWKTKVAYLVLNLCALWKKQTTLPSLAYAGIPIPGFRREGWRACFDDSMKSFGNSGIGSGRRNQREHVTFVIRLAAISLVDSFIEVFIFSAFIRFFQVFDYNLFHLKHNIHDSFCFNFIFVR